MEDSTINKSFFLQNFGTPLLHEQTSINVSNDDGTTIPAGLTLFEVSTISGEDQTGLCGREGGIRTHGQG